MEAPTPISAYLHAAAMVKAGVYLVARVVLANPAAWPAMGTVTVVMALVTMFMALMFYFVQDDLKRLLAYSTIAHLGYVLFAIGLGLLGSPVGYKGGLLHIICHGFAKSTLFLSVGAVAYAVGTRSIKALSGVGRALPLVGLAFFVGALAVTGVPPFACFWSKFLILAGTIELGTKVGVLMLILVLAESLISFAWFLRIAQIVFLGEPSPPVLAARANSAAISATLVILIVMCLAAPAIGYWLINAIQM
jgi:hydrogenase-4 component D